MSAQPSLSGYDALRDGLRWHAVHKCPALGFRHEDANSLLSVEDGLFAQALTEFSYEVRETLISRDFIVKVAQLYHELAAVPPNTPEHAAAESLLTHTLRYMFESMARSALAPLIAGELNSIADGHFNP
jgi:hypothetical protein